MHQGAPSSLLMADSQRVPRPPLLQVEISTAAPMSTEQSARQAKAPSLATGLCNRPDASTQFSDAIPSFVSAIFGAACRPLQKSLTKNSVWHRKIASSEEHTSELQ